MGILASLKKATDQATGIARPRKQELAEFVKMKKPLEFRFKDDGLVPNHPFWPFVIYRGAVRSVEQFDSAAVLEELFEANGRSSGWRHGIYHYVHYHSRKNEVLGVADGTGKVRFGGNRGRTLSLKAGDMAPRNMSGHYERIPSWPTGRLPVYGRKRRWCQCGKNEA
ncbi:cupin [Mesorhizobium sp. M0959]|uniref:cupin n=1 Tax=unclassified Mesorhizobium TaxID=325217 RepID=UPI00333A2184